jgi:hypothetical protein
MPVIGRSGVAPQMIGFEICERPWVTADIWSAKNRSSLPPKTDISAAPVKPLGYPRENANRPMHPVTTVDEAEEDGGK